VNAYGESKPRSRALSRAEYEHFSPMVRRQAMWLARKGPRRVSVSDLCAAGWSGLLDALSHADDGSVAGDFDGYATHRVKSAMLQHIEALDPHLKETRTLSRSIARAMSTLFAQLGRNPTSEEIAAGLSMKLDEYESALASIHRAGLARIEVVDLDRPVQDILSDAEGEPERSLEEAIELLPRPSQEILMLLYQEDCSIEEAAAVLGATVRETEILASEAMHRVRALTGRE
jgi:RNA polymerase sigma factor for flagellar operon FliA